MGHMRSILALFALPALSVLLVSCSAPKQAEEPQIEESAGQDMGPEEAPPPAAAEVTAHQPSAEASDMHTKCCELCKEGLSKDRTGASPDTIPCADYTDTLTPWCLEHFRGTPTMASACK